MVKDTEAVARGLLVKKLAFRLTRLKHLNIGQTDRSLVDVNVLPFWTTGKPPYKVLIHTICLDNERRSK